jgi:hypothetical protein
MVVALASLWRFTHVDTPQVPFDPSLPLGGGFGLLALGRIHRSGYGWTLSYDEMKPVAPAAPQFRVVANPTLINGKLNAGGGWAPKAASQSAAMPPS